MEQLTIEEVLDWAQDPLADCAGSPVILESSFESLADQLVTYDQTTKTKEEILEIFEYQSKRFAGCGANFGTGRTSMLRRNPKTGWQYIIDLVSAR